MSRARMLRRAWKLGRAGRAMARVIREAYRNAAAPPSSGTELMMMIHGYVYRKRFDGQRWVTIQSWRDAE